MLSIAIIGSGPTALYTAHYLLQGSAVPFSLTMYESQAEAGKGTPYHPAWNDQSMLSNIASIEIPPISETLVAWLNRQPEARMREMGVTAEMVHERAFFPRVVLGEYFQSQLQALQAEAKARGVTFEVRTSHPVKDVAVRAQGIELTVTNAAGVTERPTFSHVVMATGHVWPKQTEAHRGYFLSPWPATALSNVGNCHVGIRGTSLSAIDAVVTLAVSRGNFYHDQHGTLQYEAALGTERFHASLMSRKGLLPEADFYHPIPYEPLAICTADAIEALISARAPDLLDATYMLFKQELLLADPDYASRIGLAALDLEGFTQEYFAAREMHQPFEWAEHNLDEARRNQAAEYTVPWRYAILRMHEVIAPIVAHLNADDFKRFNAQFKPIFVDDYATVPHASIERLLALHRAGKIDILKLGEDYILDTQKETGAVLYYGFQRIHFPVFIEAMGQRSLSAHHFPFPTLRKQGVVRNATARHRIDMHRQRTQPPVDIGGVELDAAFRPIGTHPEAQLYCLSLPFMLSRFPFAQGITSSYEMGKIVAEEIIQNKPVCAKTTPMPLQTGVALLANAA